MSNQRTARGSRWPLFLWALLILIPLAWLLWMLGPWLLLWMQPVPPP